jgi:hypothetical protein
MVKISFSVCTSPRAQARQKALQSLFAENE